MPGRMSGCGDAGQAGLHEEVVDAFEEERSVRVVVVRERECVLGVELQRRGNHEESEIYRTVPVPTAVTLFPVLFTIQVSA